MSGGSSRDRRRAKRTRGIAALAGNGFRPLLSGAGGSVDITESNRD